MPAQSTLVTLHYLFAWCLTALSAQTRKYKPRMVQHKVNIGRVTSSSTRQWLQARKLAGRDFVGAHHSRLCRRNAGQDGLAAGTMRDEVWLK